MCAPFYILNAAGDPEPITDLGTWVQWFAAHANEAPRHVGRDTLPDGRFVSTVFLGLDYNASGHGAPLLFETLVFTDGTPDAGHRYATRAEALAGHARIVAAAQERA